MINRAPVKSSASSPAVSATRNTITTVNSDGRKAKLPGDTIRQVISPGRIRNLAHMFDKAALEENNSTQQLKRQPYKPTLKAHDENNNEFKTAKKNVRPLVNEAQGDYASNQSSSSYYSEKPVEADDDSSSDDYYTPARSLSLPMSRREQAKVVVKEELCEIVITVVDEEPAKDEDVHIENNDNNSTVVDKEQRCNQFDTCVEEVKTNVLRVSMQMDNDLNVHNSILKNRTLSNKLEDGDDLIHHSIGKNRSLSSRLEGDEPIQVPAPRSRSASEATSHNEVFELPPENMPAPRCRTTSRGDEQSVNGHIDALFDFVEEHLSSKQSRSSKECLYQPRFSPTVAPNVAEISQDCGSGAQLKSNNTSKNSKRVGSALATSTPQHSLRSSISDRMIRADDADISFVSTIQDTSQAEAITHYEKLIVKSEYALERNNQQIGMLNKALAQARKERKPMQEVNAQKSLLMAKERVTLLQREIKRLRALVACRRPLPNQCLEVRGSLTISNIAIHLNRNFYTRPYEISSTYSFLVLLKCGCEVESTATHNLLAHQSSRLKIVHFDEKINFCNLPVDFCVMLEVYAMAIPEKEQETTCVSIIANKCRNFLPKEKPPTTSPSGFPYGEFVRCGYVQLTRDTTGTSRFYLDEVEYPLDGTIELTSHCTTLPPAIAIDYRGFLTMYQCISGMSSWERYWAVLRRGTIFFWKYPEDESMDKPPKARLDLSTCTQYEIHPCNVEQCPRPFTFTVNVLVNTAPSVMDKKRIFLAADSRMLMKDWLESINETLAVIRGQHPYKGSILPRM